ncbi:MAG TPA: hypothetical protein VGM18_12240 [Candidatus Sulfotelmatobacter sp.]|jgi:hypothetical protein
MSSNSKYGAGILAAACLFWIVNHFHLLQPVRCSDCFFRYGVPFAFFNEGGFGGGSGIIWLGVLGDALVVVVAGAILGWTWNRGLRRRSN